MILIIFILLIIIFILISQREHLNLNLLAENFHNLFIEPNDKYLAPIYYLREDGYSNHLIDPTIPIDQINYIKNDNTTRLYENRVGLISNNLLTNYNISDLPKSKCCLVSKDLVNFKYKFTPLENEQCDINLHEIDSNQQLLFDNVNNWSNDYCKNNLNNQVIGSCRRDNFECIDFIDKDSCNYFNTGGGIPPNKEINKNVEWSNKTCNLPLHKTILYVDYSVSNH